MRPKAGKYVTRHIKQLHNKLTQFDFTVLTLFISNFKVLYGNKITSEINM